MEKTNKRPPSWIASAAVLVLYVAILCFGALFYQQLGQIEDKLSYTPPTPVQSVSIDAMMPLSGGEVYLPVYSYVFTNNGEPALLEATLSLRNTDTEGSVVITELRYFDSAGKLLEPLSDLPIQLQPMASAELLIAKQDTRGGTGGNVLIRWKSEQEISPPLFEAVMVSSKAPHSFSFTSRGVQLGGL